MAERQKIGKTDYGYSGFEIDITNALKWDETNEIAVRANTGKTDASRWYTGGGLFRDVNLLIKNARLSFARHGIYITTPVITDASANLCIQTEIENRTGKSLDVYVQVRIFDPEGNPVSQTINQLLLIREHKSGEYMLNTMEVGNPRLWSCETPGLYTAEVTLYDEDNKVADRITETFGIRSIEYSPAYGFKLNGKKSC